MNSSIEFDVDLIQRYDLAGPRYTSYPTAVQFHNQFESPVAKCWYRGPLTWDC